MISILFLHHARFSPPLRGTSLATSYALPCDVVHDDYGPIKSIAMPAYSHILLIEDDNDDRDLFLDVLNKINPDIACEITSYGYQALHMLDKLPLTSTIIFLDLQLPMMSGLLFLEILRGEE